MTLDELALLGMGGVVGFLVAVLIDVFFGGDGK